MIDKHPPDRFEDIVEGLRAGSVVGGTSARAGRHQWLGTLALIGVAVVAGLVLLVLFGLASVIGVVTTGLLLVGLVSAGRVSPPSKSSWYGAGHPPDGSH